MIVTLLKGPTHKKMIVTNILAWRELSRSGASARAEPDLVFSNLSLARVKSYLSQHSNQVKKELDSPHHRLTLPAKVADE